LIPSTQDELVPEGPARCIACPSTTVRIVAVDGHQVWCCQACERILVRPAGITTGSRGRVLA
jgi:ribosomal protein L37AE/L43A